MYSKILTLKLNCRVSCELLVLTESRLWLSWSFIVSEFCNWHENNLAEKKRWSQTEQIEWSEWVKLWCWLWSGVHTQLIFYYGATDHWCPVQFYQDMKQDFPHADLRLCERGFRHAFVLDAGSQVAHMVVQWLPQDLTAWCHAPPPSSHDLNTSWREQTLWTHLQWPAHITIVQL